MFKHLSVNVFVQPETSMWPHSVFELCYRGNESSPVIIVEKQMNGTCHNNNTASLFLTAENVPTGNYTIIVKAQDDRCLSGSLWTESVFCQWELLASGTVSFDVPAVAVTNDIIMWIVIALAVILFHALIIMWFVIRKQKQQILEAQHESSVPLCTRKSKANLLILYPRDCFHFMKTMSSIRMLLEQFDNIEVHDCYSIEDPFHDDPLDWLRTAMNLPQLQILIVTTPCAYIIQEAIQTDAVENPSSVYRNPSYLDSVFIYGLKQLMNDFSGDVYKRVHIIGFGGFSDDSKILSLPSSLARYNIPEHLDALISKMSLEYRQGGSYQYSPEYISLRNSITNLKSYSRQNPEYLREVLNLSEPNKSAH